MNSKMIEKQKYRRNSFAADYGAKDDDFILADLDLMRDEEEPSPVPLNHFMDDEDVIDSLLVGAHYSAEDEQDQADSKPDALAVDDISLADELADIDEITAEEDAIDRLLVNTGFDDTIELEHVAGKPDARVVADISTADAFAGSDQLVVEPVELTEQNLLPETEEIDAPNVHLMADFDDIQDKEDAMMTDQALLDSENSKLTFDKEEASDLMVREDDTKTVNEKQATPELVFDSLNNPEKNELNISGTEQENIQQLIQAYEHKAKKAAVIAYASLGIGFFALLSAVIMGAVVFGMHSKIAKLSDLVSILEEDMASIAGKNSDLDINNNAASIEQLNQKLNSQPESLEEHFRK